MRNLAFIAFLFLFSIGHNLPDEVNGYARHGIVFIFGGIGLFGLFSCVRGSFGYYYK
tara:strand:+ start:52 stop:222 length:171 start_codon:yes stop_codon:yes gene_type:complete